MSAERTGRILESGTISAAKIAAGLGLGGPDSLKKDDPEGPPETPSQARERMSGKKPKKLISDANVKVTVVKGGRDVAAFFGVSGGTPLGDGEEGQPLDPEPLTHKQEAEREAAKRQTVDWERIDEQREARRIGDKLTKMQDRARALVRKEAQIEAARKRRKRRAS